MEIVQAVADTLVRASTCLDQKQVEAMQNAYDQEENERARWALGLIINNQEIARERRFPLCSDTGVPHLIFRVEEEAVIPANLFPEVYEGIAQGLRRLPGCPTAAKGNDMERLGQSNGLYEDPGKLVPPAPIIITRPGNQIELTVLMLGGGPEIRTKSFQIEHRRDSKRVMSIVTKEAVEMAKLLGCTPCIPAIGIGRSFFEASTMMLEAVAFGQLDDHEAAADITEALNASRVGPLGLGGGTTALGTFLRIGPQKASGIRVACIRMLCHVEPRRANLLISG